MCCKISVRDRYRHILLCCYQFCAKWLCTLTDTPIHMGTVVKIAPVVATRWEDIGYRLWLEDKEMENIENEVLKSGDIRLASKKVLKTWIKCTHGRQPKTWRMFITVLQELGIDIGPVVELLQKEPVIAYS